MYFPIEKSERTFLVLVPFIREAQRLKVERAYGDGWDELLAEKRFRRVMYIMRHVWLLHCLLWRQLCVVFRSVYFPVG